MYKELGSFLWCVLRQKSMWKDGELWTAAAGGIASWFWFRHDPSPMDGMREHFADLLTITSIVFGFVMTTLVFYVQAASTWSKDSKVKTVATRIIDWHVWTILCMLAQIALTVALMAARSFPKLGPKLLTAGYSLLIFLTLYCAFQIVNHTLTIWWAFRRSSNFEGK